MASFNSPSQFSMPKNAVFTHLSSKVFCASLRLYQRNKLLPSNNSFISAVSLWFKQTPLIFTFREIVSYCRGALRRGMVFSAILKVFLKSHASVRSAMRKLEPIFLRKSRILSGFSC